MILNKQNQENFRKGNENGKYIFLSEKKNRFVVLYPVCLPPKETRSIKMILKHFYSEPKHWDVWIFKSLVCGQ